MSEKDIVTEAREMADDYRYDIQPATRATIRALADEVERLRKQLAQAADEGRSGMKPICTHPNTYPLGTATRRCHDCGMEILS